MSYYAYCEWAPSCPYCQCDRLIQLSSDVTCSNCGAEQGYGNFQEDHPAKAYQDAYEDVRATIHSSSVGTSTTSMCTITSKRALKAVAEKSAIRVPHDIFDSLAQCSTIPEHVIDTAKTIYIKYTESHVIRGIKSRTALAMACIYYASRAFAPVEIKELLRAGGPAVDEHDFSRACRDIKTALGSMCEFKSIMITKASYDITHDINKALSRITCVPSSVLQDLRKTIFQLVDRAPLTSELATLPQMTIAATIVYMATRVKKIKVTMKALCDDFDITTTTMMKTESKLMDAIKGAKK